MSIVHIPFYPSDWLAGTRGLSDAETGVYITLIARMYEMAGPIERNDQRLSRLCGSKSRPAFSKALDHLISEGKIVETNEGLFNNRVQKEIENVVGKSSKAKSAAQSRWDRKSNKNKGGSHADASAKHMPQPCQPKPKPKEVATATSSAQQREDVQDPDLVDEVMAAVGLTSGRIPTHWLPPGSMVHVNRWVTDLGLTRGEIVAAARSSRQQHSEPPNGPKALDRVMQSLSQAKAGGRKLAATDDRGEAVPTIPRASPVPADGADIPSESFPDTLPPADPKFATR